MTKDTATNASGDLFEIWRRDGEWIAEQITGRDSNWLGVPAYLRAKSRTTLLAELRQHHSNT